MNPAPHYELLTGDDWSPTAAAEAARALNRIARRDRDTLLEILAEPGVPQDCQQRMIRIAAEMTAAERRETLELYRSGDPERRSLAKTRLNRLPPMPWHRLTWLREAFVLVDKALGDGKPHGQAELEAAATSLRAALEVSEQAYQQFRREELER